MAGPAELMPTLEEPIRLPLPEGCMGVPPHGLRSACAMGVDVRPNSWDVLIADVHRPRGGGGGGHCPRLVFAGKVRDERDVIFLARQYPVVCGVVDSRPDGTLATRLVERLRKHKKEFYRAQYSTMPSRIPMQVNARVRLITLERTMTLDDVWLAFSQGMVGLPLNYRDITGGSFVSELTGPSRVPIVWQGEEWAAWTKCVDHTFHAFNYLVTAMKVGRLWLPRGNALMASRGNVVQQQAAERDPYEDPYAGAADPDLGRARREPAWDDDGSTIFSDTLYPDGAW